MYPVAKFNTCKYVRRGAISVTYILYTWHNKILEKKENNNRFYITAVG